jgi:hypothetical protein
MTEGAVTAEAGGVEFSGAANTSLLICQSGNGAPQPPFQQSMSNSASRHIACSDQKMRADMFLDQLVVSDDLENIAI